MMPVSPADPGATLAGRFRGFQDLAQHRIENILLVSSLYDSFILAEDGQLGERILSEFLDLSFRHSPAVTRVSSGAEALALASGQRRFNLIITSMHIGDMDAPALARKVKEAGLAIPVVLLAYDARELALFLDRHDTSDLERVYLWQGDVTILLAIVKEIEDRLNVADDTALMGVQVVIVIEDNVRYYSSFLPVIYTELMHHSEQLAPEGVNLSHRLMRIQARPKILLCQTFEEAWARFSAYQENVLGVISDVEFPMDGRVAPEAGVAFARRVREAHPDVPVALQSSLPANKALAESVGAAFLLKESPLLLQQLRRFMVDSFGFGDFVFRLPDRTEVGRAPDLRTLEDLLASAPAESIAYHAERNHFSRWLKARTEFAIAHYMRPRQLSDYADLESLRRDLVESIRRVPRSSGHGRRSRTSTGTPSTRGTSSRESAAGRSAARRAAWRSSTCCSTSTTRGGASPTSRSPCRRRSSWRPTCSTGSSTTTSCAASPSSATTRRNSCGASSPPRCRPTSRAMSRRSSI